MDLSRRGFIKLSAGAPAPLGFNPADASLRYELVIANGDVLDPVQRKRARRDVGIRFGQIAAPRGPGAGSDPRAVLSLGSLRRRTDAPAVREWRNWQTRWT
ncbi:MAG TPA: twin-arginine translocation signal domain-containing protein [Methylomirabilota bacterium]|nr:twin-arginine translocation signal domain-containing protein [Methylomirabilota bacterium]